MSQEQADPTAGNGHLKVKEADVDTVFSCLEYLGVDPTEERHQNLPTSSASYHSCTLLQMSWLLQKSRPNLKK